MSNPFKASLGSLTDPNMHQEMIELGDVSTVELLRWYESMVLIRRTEEIIGTMVESGEARCPCHLGIGQEAVAVGVASALEANDRALGAHRSHSHYLAMGGPVDKLLAEVLGKVTGCSRGYGGSMHLRSPAHGLIGTVPIVSATVPIAVGAGLAAKLDGGDALAVSFLGDGATEEGVFHESLNLAASMELPVLFVVENNLYSSHLHISNRQPNDRVARYAEAHFVRSEVIDGNDVVSVAATVQRLVKGVRETRRPALIEAVTYRWRGHVGHRDDNDVGVERTDNLASWRQRDPVRRLSDALVSHALTTIDELRAIDRCVDNGLDRALEFARASEYPDVSDMANIVYAARTGA